MPGWERKVIYISSTFKNYKGREGGTDKEKRKGAGWLANIQKHKFTYKCGVCMTMDKQVRNLSLLHCFH